MIAKETQKFKFFAKKRLTESGLHDILINVAAREHVLCAQNGGNDP